MNRIISSALKCIALTVTSAFLLSPLDSSAFSIQPVNKDAPFSDCSKKAESSNDADLKYANIPVSDLKIGNLSPDITTDLDYTYWWYSEWDDCRYVFLPSTADRSSLVISYTADDTLFLNDEPVKSNKTTDLLSKADSFSIKVGGKDCGTLKIMQSNLGCIYISTSNTGLDALDANRNLTETGKILMLSSDGHTEYSGDIDKLTSHGNSSWDFSQKKSYNLKLAKKADLYGMGKAKKWVLLSNYLDHSMLRNKLTEEMCKSAGIECVMDSVYADLYADGSYRGTYQLYEKVQIQKNRINIRDLEEETEEYNIRDLEEYPQVVVGANDCTEYMENSYKYFDIPNDPDDITGGYLLEFQQWNRYGTKCDSGFVTSRGQAVAVKEPQYASKAQIEYIRSLVQDAEDAIYSKDGYNSKGRHYSDYIDVDSFAKAYLVQEISENIDATSSSFFLWKDSDENGDGKLHFSPEWDFDFSYNNLYTICGNSDGKRGYSNRYNSLYAAYMPIHGYDDGIPSSSSKSGRPTVGISWAGTLYKDDDFIRLVAKYYFKDFRPYLDELATGDTPYLKRLADTIRPSAEMNNARWHTYGGDKYSPLPSIMSGSSFTDSAEMLRSFIEKRSGWLSELWLPYTYLKGDINADGVFSVADAVALQSWLLSQSDTSLTHWQAADLCRDDRLDIFDLTSMKKELLSK